MKTQSRQYNFMGYKLTMHNMGYNARQGKYQVAYTLKAPNGTTLFNGNDFFASPLHNPVSIDSALSLMTFLTCRPGDTDSEYFDHYTQEQLDFAQSYACEQLSYHVSDREETRYKRQATR